MAKDNKRQRLQTRKKELEQKSAVLLKDQDFPYINQMLTFMHKLLMT